MISIVMANYNGGAYLQEAIDSVLTQEDDDFELLVVDDASTDRSRDVLEDCNDRAGSRMRVLMHTRNEGQAASFNTAFRECLGDVVCFLDSDDYWLAGKLPWVRQITLEHPEAAVYQHNLLMLRDGSLTDQPFRPLLFSGDYREFCRSSRTFPEFVATSGLVFPRWVLERVFPVPSEFRTCADGFLTRASFMHGAVISEYRAFGAYRVHEANQTFENPVFDASRYRDALLLPALKSYYDGLGVSMWYTGMAARGPRRLVKEAMHALGFDIVRHTKTPS